MRTELILRFDYGRAIPFRVLKRDYGISAVSGPNAMADSNGGPARPARILQL